MKKIYLLFISIVLFLVACEDRTDLTEPIVLNGDGNFSNYVALGNSLTAGLQNNYLYESSQNYSFPKLIADQVGSSFSQPYVSAPGIGSPGKIVIKDIIYDENNNITSVITSFDPSLGSPLYNDYPAPFNNLGIPGAKLFDFIDSTDFAVKSSNTGNIFINLVLRNQAFGKSAISQVVNQSPSLVTFWGGNNDILGHATSGGTSSYTSVADFTSYYNEIISRISATGADVFIGNLLNINAIPYFTTVGPSVALSLDGLPIAGVFYELSYGNVSAIPASLNELLTGSILMTLSGSTYASLIGTPNGRFYSDNNIPLPAGYDTLQAPFGLSPQNPIPDALVLDKDEITNILNIISQYNSVISSAASNYANVYLVDVASEFNDLKSKELSSDGGKYYNGILFSTRFLSGNLFSLDGVHPTTQGYGIVANLFIKKINQELNASIPEINISTLPSSIDLAN